MAEKPEVRLLSPEATEGRTWESGGFLGLGRPCAGEDGRLPASQRHLQMLSPHVFSESVFVSEKEKNSLLIS